MRKKHSNKDVTGLLEIEDITQILNSKRFKNRNCDFMRPTRCNCYLRYRRKRLLQVDLNRHERKCNLRVPSTITRHCQVNDMCNSVIKYAHLMSNKLATTFMKTLIKCQDHTPLALRAANVIVKYHWIKPIVQYNNNNDFKTISKHMKINHNWFKIVRNYEEYYVDDMINQGKYIEHNITKDLLLEVCWRISHNCIPTFLEDKFIQVIESNSQLLTDECMFIANDNTRSRVNVKLVLLFVKIGLHLTDYIIDAMFNDIHIPHNIILDVLLKDGLVNYGIVALCKQDYDPSFYIELAKLIDSSTSTYNGDALFYALTYPTLYFPVVNALLRKNLNLTVVDIRNILNIEQVSDKLACEIIDYYISTTRRHVTLAEFPLSYHKLLYDYQVSIRRRRRSVKLIKCPISRHKLLSRYNIQPTKDYLLQMMDNNYDISTIRIPASLEILELWATKNPTPNLPNLDWEQLSSTPEILKLEYLCKRVEYWPVKNFMLQFHQTPSTRALEIVCIMLKKSTIHLLLKHGAKVNLQCFINIVYGQSKYQSKGYFYSPSNEIDKFLKIPIDKKPQWFSSLYQIQKIRKKNILRLKKAYNSRNLDPITMPTLEKYCEYPVLARRCMKTRLNRIDYEQLFKPLFIAYIQQLNDEYTNWKHKIIQYNENIHNELPVQISSSASITYVLLQLKYLQTPPLNKKWKSKYTHLFGKRRITFRDARQIIVRHITHNNLIHKKVYFIVDPFLDEILNVGSGHIIHINDLNNFVTLCFQ